MLEHYKVRKLKKGIFITTGSFSKDAREFISKIESKIVLVDGKQSTEYMIDNDIGVTTVESYQIKKLDQDYFGEITE